MTDAHEVPVRIRRLGALGAEEVAALAEVLIDCVDDGASVSFMPPLSHARAAAFWREVGRSAERGERVLLAAEEPGGAIVGTVQLLFAPEENQPHRADLAKMLVHRRARRRGVATALLDAAERHALAAGRTLLVLDTGNDAAARLYARHGWLRCGEIPGYALWPDGRPCDTTIWFKALAPHLQDGGAI